MKNKNAESWIDKGNVFNRANNYKKAIVCYEKAILLTPNDVSVLDSCGIALTDIAKIKQDHTLFERVFEIFDRATELKLLNTDKAISLNSWGIALSCMAEIKQDNLLFKSAFEKFNLATTLDRNNATIFYNWGLAFYHLADIKQNEDLFKCSFEKYYMSIQLGPTNVLALCNWGLALCNLAGIKEKESLFEDAIEKYRKAEDLDQDNAYVLNDGGIALSMLAEIKQDETLFNCAFRKYDNFIRLYPNCTFGFYNHGLALYRLAEIKRDEDQYRKSVEYFKKSKRDILSIFANIYKNNNEQTFQTEYFRPMLDSADTIDASFFAKSTTTIEKDCADMNKYKDIYLKAIFIISLLHINNPNEKAVAHYREKDISQKVLFKNDSHFRLNAIDNSNDPDEGKTLLDFLYGIDRSSSNENVNTEYEAFAGCFTFDYNNLNLFRLYGKENGKEGTGLSLVFRNNFFSKDAKTAFESPNLDFLNMETTGESQNLDSHKITLDNPIEKKKLALFRCIYIDPNLKTDRPIVTVGQKEERLFYKDELGDSSEKCDIDKEKEIEDKFKEYNQKMERLTGLVREKLAELKKLANELDPTIVGQLLLNLRYLVKHVAFKEEQECRIVKILHLHDKDIHVDPDFKQMYINYAPSVPMHLEKIYFGPKATGIELFQSMLKNKKLNIPCEKSTNPLA